MKRLAVIGHPISHSRSPTMQNAALRELGMADEWRYEAIDIAPEDLAHRLREIARDPEFIGLNVTIPHKEGALAAADTASEAARSIGAANTLVFGPDGSIHAENTDAPGLLAAIEGSVAGLRALVLGAGGAARAAVWALREAGAAVTIWARRAEAAEGLAAEFGVASRGGEEPFEFGLVVNATAAGLGDGRALEHLPLGIDDLREGLTLVDMVYGERETDLTAAARRAGCRVVDGIEILVRQGALSFEIWTSKPAPLEAMRRAARKPS